MVVVDNGSTDGSPDLIASAYPSVRLIRMERNEGVCRGYNLAIAGTTCPTILILNTDVFLNRDFLCRALASLESDSRIGSVAAQVRDARTTEVLYRGLFLRPWIGVSSGRGDSHPRFAFGGSGSVMLCRREMLDDVAVDGEVLDDAYFAYLEDIDLAWRAQLRGWSCLYDPRASALHIGSASMGERIRVIEKPAFFQRHIWKNRYLLVLANASPLEMIVLAPWLLGFELLTWPYLLFRLPSRLPTFLLAHIDVVRLSRGLLQKRRFVTSRRLLRAGGILRFFRFWGWR